MISNSYLSSLNLGLLLSYRDHKKFKGPINANTVIRQNRGNRFVPLPITVRLIHVLKQWCK